MRLWRGLLGSVATALTLSLLGGCSGAKEAVKPDDGTGGSSAVVAVPAEKDDLALVFENIFDVPADARIAANLLDPKTVDDAQAIVRSDNPALFDKADRVFAEHLKGKPDDLKNLTWHAQLFLAWADSAALTARTLDSSVEKLAKRQAALTEKLAGDSLSDQDRAKAQQALAETEQLIPLVQKVLGQLEQVAAQKKAIGKEKTQALLKQHRDTYEGYRLAADCYRIEEDWGNYGDALAKLEKLNPQSNGLLFIKGVVAFQRDREYGSAERYLSQAVGNDAQFTKAQYYLALTYVNMRRFDDAQRALDQTLALSPGHPFANAVKKLVARLSRM
ncbi:MAG: tetratricopeptide repeat protein [Deltaproteobacteria bacterium]|nr:tetratricopeptide repeat protein [Deltaproteobacteria bacterium]